MPAPSFLSSSRPVAVKGCYPTRCDGNCICVRAVRHCESALSTRELISALTLECTSCRVGCGGMVFRLIPVLHLMNPLFYFILVLFFHYAVQVFDCIENALIIKQRFGSIVCLECIIHQLLLHLQECFRCDCNF